MKHKKMLALIACTAVIGSQTGVLGAEIENVILSDFDNSILTVSGKGEEKSVTVYAVPQGTVIEPGFYDDTATWSIQHTELTDSEFSVSFKLKGTEGVYDFYVTGAENPYSFEYISKDTILDFVEKLGNNEIEQEKIFEMLVKYNANLDTDISFADTESKQEYTAKNFYRYSDKIKENGLAAVKEIAEITKYELEFMKELEKTEYYSTVNNLLTDYSKKADIKLDDYNNLQSWQKEAVCKSFVGKKYSDIENFKDDFDKSVEDNSTLPKPNGSSGGSSSGSSGSSSGSSYSGSGSSAGMPVVSVPAQNTEEKNEAEALFEKYTDIDDVEWAWDAVLYMDKNGIMNGVGSNVFAPNDVLTREQLAKIIATAFGYTNNADNAEFSDVPQNHWAKSYISAAASNGLMIGVEKEIFGLGKNMTRQDLCVTVYRAALKKGMVFTNRKTDFTDYDGISDYAKDAVAYLSGKGIVNGTGNGAFEPDASVTRAETAKIIYGILGGAK